jgi:hypothetical protein
MTELAVHETLFTASCSIPGGIVKMHYRLCRMHTWASMQDFVERPSDMDAEVAAVELLSSGELIREHDALGVQKDRQHRFRGGNGLAHSFRHFISRHTPDLPILGVLQKPGLISSYDVAEANS